MTRGVHGPAETAAPEERDSDAAITPFIARHSRRLSDKILAAFHHACDLGDLEVADDLLQLLEMMTTRRSRPEDGNRRRNIQSLVAAHERLWHLKHPADAHN